MPRNRHRVARLSAGLVAALVVMTAPAAAQRAEGSDRPAPRAGAGVLSLLPPDVSSEMTVPASGQTLGVVAKAGTLTLVDRNAEPLAAIYYTAYRLKNGGEARPLTFVFNGGPGASSVYLHLGLAGPQVAVFGSPPDGAAARLEPNAETWLAFTDLVFIDPVGTGWSRAAKQDNDFWGVRQDAEALAKAVALYVSREGRAASPKFLLGESYGGFRAIKVARALQRDQGLVVSGLVLLSPLLDGTFTFGGRSALAAALQLPSLAAAALDRRGAFSEEALRAAERFAMTDYLVTLAGRPPRGAEANAFYAKVAALTDLPVEAVTRARGFLRDVYQRPAGRASMVSAYDAVYGVPDPYPEEGSAEGRDPMLDGHLQALGGLFVGYARNQLGFKTDMTFQLLNREVSGKWDWGGGRTQATVQRDMRELLAFNPSLRVHIAHGRSDVVTPYAVSRYVIDHLPEFAEARIALSLYKGGHMFYFDKDARAAFGREMRGFYAPR